MWCDRVGFALAFDETDLAPGFYESVCVDELSGIELSTHHSIHSIADHEDSRALESTKPSDQFEDLELIPCGVMRQDWFCVGLR